MLLQTPQQRLQKPDSEQVLLLTLVTDTIDLIYGSKTYYVAKLEIDLVDGNVKSNVD